jgi:hypothetical protein
VVHGTPAGVTVTRGFGRPASLSQKFSGSGTGTGTEVEVDYQPPRGNRLEEKDRFRTGIRLDESITNGQLLQALTDLNSRTEGFTVLGEHSSLDLLYDTFCSRCQ